MHSSLRNCTVLVVGLISLALGGCAKQAGGTDAPQAGEPRPGQSMDDKVNGPPPGGMTVQPPAEPVGPTPSSGGSGSAGTGTGMGTGTGSGTGVGNGAGTGR